MAAPYLEGELTLIARAENAVDGEPEADVDIARMVANNRLVSAVAEFESRFPGITALLSEVAFTLQEASDPSSVTRPTFNDAIEIVKGYIMDAEDKDGEKSKNPSLAAAGWAILSRLESRKTKR